MNHEELGRNPRSPEPWANPEQTSQGAERLRTGNWPNGRGENGRGENGRGGNDRGENDRGENDQAEVRSGERGTALLGDKLADQARSQTVRPGALAFGSDSSAPNLSSPALDRSPVSPASELSNRFEPEPAPTAARRPANLRPVESFVGEAVNKLFWMLCLAALIFGTLQIGPYLVERYQYAATAGRVKAEYENAVSILKDNPLAGISKAYQLVAQAVKPSVVSIKCIKVAAVGRRSQAIIGAGQGSGVIISADGYIVTNAHVIEDSGDILVKLSDRREFPAVVVGADPLTDVAVLKIKADKLIPARWGDSELLEVGSIVWAIGTPYELEQTVTSGVVSGKNRYEREGDIERVQQELIQTDAAVNPGNSGGPLINTEGLIVGINTSIYGDKFQGISFAVPSQIARYVAEQLIANGEVRRGFLGFIPQAVNAAQAAVLSLPDFDGAHIREVTPNSPADLAGLRVDDVIRRWNDVKIQDHRDVFRLVATTPPNSKARVEIIRDGKLINLEVVTGDRDELQPTMRRN